MALLRIIVLLGYCLTLVTSRHNIFNKTRHKNNVNSNNNANVNSTNNYVNNITVGAFYYPWYTRNFHGGHYLRGDLIPPQSPALGEYDQRNASVISQHLAWSRQANVKVWFTSWWGPNSTTDEVTRSSILTNPNLGDFQIAILYETMGRMGENNHSNNNSTNTTTDIFYSDMKYLAQNYFGHANYYRIQNRPVVFVYVTRYLRQIGQLQKAIAAMRAGAMQQGYNIYIIGDEVFKTYRAGNIDNTTCQLLDALGTYDVYGSMGRTGYAGRRAVSLFGRQQKGWRVAAHDYGCAFIPSISPGFNDRGVRTGHAPLARQVIARMGSGSLFRALLQRSLTLVENDYAGTGNLMLVTSWNEWHEDTQIEPTAPLVASSNVSISTNQPLNLTAGIQYDSYGTIYLDLLSQLTTRLS